jgi:SNF2 family DNA or RNA helicase
MLTTTNLHDYQRECINHMLTNKDAMLWLQMGLGKTIITLTSIVSLMEKGKVSKTLIFGPLRVIESVWTTEAEKWAHTKHLRFSIVRGNAKERTRALFRDADIYLINYEQMNWLAETLCHYYNNKKFPFECAVYDEVSKLKNSTSLRVAGGNRDRKDKKGEYHKVKITGWRKLIDAFKYRYGLTGTPASNGYLDLHGQFLAVDGGTRLGKYITHFKESYFSKGYDGWTYKITDNGKHWIERRISDITKKMDAKDYLDMPSVKVTNIMVDLPPKIRRSYQEIEKDMFTELDSGTEVEIFNSASLSNKCLQFCNGAPYTNTETKEWEALHDVKLEVLKDILEEAAGAPVLCSYTFKSDAERIMKYFNKYKPVNLTKEAAKDTNKIIDRWNDGKIQLMIGHTKSMGHGLDRLQNSGSIIVWFGLTWSLEQYEQMNGRLDRQGQTKPVSIIRILCNNTVDLAVLDAIEHKDTEQKGLKASLDRYRIPCFL